MSEFLDKYHKEDIYMVNDASERMAGKTVNDDKYWSPLTHFVRRNSQNKLHLYKIKVFVFPTRPLFREKPPPPTPQKNKFLRLLVYPFAYEC